MRYCNNGKLRRLRKQSLMLALHYIDACRMRHDTTYIPGTAYNLVEVLHVQRAFDGIAKEVYAAKGQSRPNLITDELKDLYESTRKLHGSRAIGLAQSTRSRWPVGAGAALIIIGLLTLAAFIIVLPSILG